MGWATSWANRYQAHLVTLLPSKHRLFYAMFGELLKSDLGRIFTRTEPCFNYWAKTTTYLLAFHIAVYIEAALSGKESFGKIVLANSTKPSKSELAILMWNKKNFDYKRCACMWSTYVGMYLHNDHSFRLVHDRFLELLFSSFKAYISGGSGANPGSLSDWFRTV
jgi:hypothetical protein